MVGWVGRRNFFLSIGVGAKVASSIVALVDLVLEITLTPSRGVLARFSSRVLELFFLDGPSIVDNFLSVLYMSWVGSGI